jgi:hypothetical protein
MTRQSGPNKLLVVATFAGFALGLASTSGFLEASPRVSAAVQAPRSEDVQAPRSEDVQAPRSEEVQAPRSEDVQAPRSEDVEAP